MSNLISIEEYKKRKNMKIQKEFDEFIEGLDFIAAAQHLSGKDINYKKYEAFKKSVRQLELTDEERDYIVGILENK